MPRRKLPPEEVIAKKRARDRARRAHRRSDPVQRSLDLERKRAAYKRRKQSNESVPASPRSTSSSDGESQIFDPDIDQVVHAAEPSGPAPRPPPPILLEPEPANAEAILRNDTYYFNRWRNFVRAPDTEPDVLCPTCQTRVAFKSYEVHGHAVHGIPRRTACVYCQGYATWPKGQKKRHSRHLSECSERFHRMHKIAPPVIEPPVLLGIDETLCAERCFLFDSETKKVEWNVMPDDWTEEQEAACGISQMYEPLFQREDVPWLALPDRAHRLREAALDPATWYPLLNTLRFHERSGLGDVHTWIFRYWLWREDTSWFHLMVRAGCMASAVRALEGLDLVALPYWCVCNGGVRRANIETHHRHWIVVVRNEGAYRNALRYRLQWGIEPALSSRKKFYNRKILSVRHLIASIAYVSRPQSKCQCERFLDEESPRPWWVERVDRAVSHRAHYVMAHPVAHHAIWWMLLLAPEKGVDDLVRFRISNRRLSTLTTLRKVNRRWEVNASEECGVKNCVVAVEPFDVTLGAALRPEEVASYVLGEEERPFAYWFGGRVLRTSRNERMPADPLACAQMCVRNRINTLLNVQVLEESWCRLPKKRASHANDVQTMRQEMETGFRARLAEVREETHHESSRIRALEAEIEAKNAEIVSLRARYVQLEEAYAKDKKEWEEREKQFRDQIEKLLTDRIAGLEREVVRLETENAALRVEKTGLEKRNATLTVRVETFKRKNRSLARQVTRLQGR